MRPASPITEAPAQPARREWCARGARGAWRASCAWAAAAGLPLLAAGRALAQTAAAPPSAPPAADPTPEGKAPPLPAVGQPLALPEMELLDGQRFGAAQADGRVLLLYWWASWCPFCALTSPHVDKLWQAQRARGLQMLTLSIDRRAEDARSYLQRRGYAWPTVWVNAALQQRLPKPRGLPVIVVRGRDGRVLQAEGGQQFPEDVEALARHLG